MSEKEIDNLNTNADEITEKDSLSSKLFVKARDKYSDMKSSALCLFIISVAGLIIIALDYFDMFPMKLNPNNSWIFYFAMSALFIIFFVVAIFTLKSAKKVKATISDEESLTDTIIAWSMDNLTAKYIDEKCTKLRTENVDETESFEELPEELKCFEREDVITNEIKNHFNIDDDAYIASILEEIYPEIFE